MIAKKFWYIFISVILVISFMPAGCSSENTSTTATSTTTASKTVVPSVQAPASTAAATSTAAAKEDWWAKFGEPQYGGTLTVRASSLDNISFDPIVMTGPANWTFWIEPLYYGNDWTLDRSVWSFKSGFMPVEYYQGQLAESWEQVDATTIRVYLKKGIHWQNKEPVNGREFVADDVVFNFDRILGTGSGFSQANPFFAGMIPSIAKAEKVDNYTVDFKLKAPNAMAIYQVFSSPSMMAPETIQQDLTKDWTKTAGTGPWILSNYVAGSTLEFTANPDYWGNDERYPENRIPYLDTYKLISIPEMSTTLAAIRSGKIDMITDVNGGLTWQQTESLSESNPEIEIGWLPNTGVDLDIRCDLEPFSDIRVRQALNMAIDRQAIAQSHYGGFVDGVPAGLVSSYYTGWALPYDEWPSDIQKIYSYNAEDAKALLAEAGYPDGFSTSIVCRSADDTTLMQILKSFYMEIGIEVEIEVMDTAGYLDYVRAGKQTGMAASVGVAMLTTPTEGITMRKTGHNRNFTHNNDATFDTMMDNLSAASSIEEAQTIVAEADQYALSQCWTVQVCPTATSFAWQPWVMGYSGEIDRQWWTVARLWVDKDLKASLGY